jgi:hypothetical protein
MPESANDTIHFVATAHAPDFAVICNLLLVSFQPNFGSIRQVQTVVLGWPSGRLSCDGLTRLTAFAPLLTVGCEPNALTFNRGLTGARGLEAYAAGQDHRAESCSATHGSTIQDYPTFRRRARTTVDGANLGFQHSLPQNQSQRRSLWSEN